MQKNTIYNVADDLKLLMNESLKNTNSPGKYSIKYMVF